MWRYIIIYYTLDVWMSGLLCAMVKGGIWMTGFVFECLDSYSGYFLKLQLKTFEIASKSTPEASFWDTQERP